MTRALSVVAAVALLGIGALAGWLVESAVEDTVTVVETSTVTRTTTVEAPERGLPDAVVKTRDALLEAAEARDYDALERLLPAGAFSYTFGGPVPGGPVAFWKDLEHTAGQRPLERLEQVLRMPYTLSRGIYVWPFSYDVASVDDLTAHERGLLAPLGPLESVFVEGTGYLGWRAGIQPDGTWVFFVAGD